METEVEESGCSFKVYWFKILAMSESLDIFKIL